MRFRAGQKQFARQLRSHQTEAERRLWGAIRRRALGVLFHRQVALGPYIVDFACFERSLVIEVDGGQHADNPQDRVRDAWLEAQGFTILRFWNPEVLTNLPGVLDAIDRAGR